MASVAACSSDREGESPPLTVETQIEINEQLTETKVPETTLEVEATTSAKSPVFFGTPYCTPGDPQNSHSELQN